MLWLEVTKRRIDEAKIAWVARHNAVVHDVEPAPPIPRNRRQSELYARALERLVDVESTEEVTARLDEIYAIEDSRIDDDLARVQRRAVTQSP